MESATLYTADAYCQLFPPTDGPVSSTFNSKENGDHYQEERHFFEWWYFDAAFDDGSCLVAILHSSLYNAIDHKPTLDLRYYPQRGDPVVAIGRFERTAYSAATDRCYVRIGDCTASDEGDHYRLSLHQGPLAAELTFWPELPGWKAGSGHLFYDPISGHHFDWVVPLPRARVEGTLAVGGHRREVAGVGYHDHNWGNLHLPAAFSKWTWGRVVARDWTIVFGDVIGRGVAPPCVTPFMLARDCRVLLSTDSIRVVGEGPAREPRTGAPYFRRLLISTVDGPTVKLVLTARRAMEALDFAAIRPFLARHFRLQQIAESAFYMSQGIPLVGRLAAWLLGRGTYLRWEAEFHLDLPEYSAVETGRALYEVMQFGG
jgi:hypothetical protein